MSWDPTAPPGAPDDLEPLLDEGREIVRSLAAGVEALAGDGAAAGLDGLALLTHRLRGSAALYGLEGVAALAAAMERAVDGLRAPHPGGGAEPAGDGGRGVLAEAVAELGAALERAARDGAASDGPPPGELVERLDALAGARAAEGATEDRLADRLRGFAGADPEVLEFFGPEAREHADDLAEALGRLAAGGEADEAIDTAFRLVHTLKGAAYMVGCEPVGELAHAIEDLLEPAREGRLAIGPPELGALDDALDVLQRMLAALDGSRVAVAGPFERATARLGRLAAGARDAAERDAAPDPEPPAAPEPDRPAATAAPADAEAPSGERSIRVGLDRIDLLMDLVGEAVTARGRLELQLRRLAEIERLIAASRGRMAGVAEELEHRQLSPAAVRERPAEAAGRQPAAASALRLEEFSELELDRYDALDVLMRQVAELSFDLGETLGELGEVKREIGGELERTAKLHRALRAAVGRTRMRPLAGLFDRFRRRAERLARQHGRPVRLEVYGDRVEVDTAIVERLNDPLLHLVANALTHGVESAEERLAAGKPEVGTLALGAFVRGAFVEIEVEDDGRGLDSGLLRRRAVELGVCSAAEAERLSDAEALELIFLPGFTTEARATETSGRGVGLDVVRSAVAELNGQIRTETASGVGTRLTLRLPIGLSITAALALRVGGEVFALPTLAVRRLAEIAAGEVERRDGRRWVEIDGAPVEVIRLADLLALRADRDGGGLRVAVVQAPGREVALAVDELVGIEEVVVKPLGGFLAGLEGYAGVTVRPDGRVTLVLDPATLPGLATAAGRPRPVERVAEPAAPAAGAVRILLADDSVSVRRIVGRRLTAAGYQVVAVQDGEQALAELREGRFAALVTDLEMPRLNGFELLEIVRRRPESRELPVIVITTRAGRKHREQVAGLGVSAYFGKPIDFDELLTALGAITAGAAVPGAAAGTAADGAARSPGGAR